MARAASSKERLHELVDELSEQEADETLELIVLRRKQGSSASTDQDDVSEDAGQEADVVGLPESWATFEDGTPQPNWVAAVHRSRSGH